MNHSDDDQYQDGIKLPTSDNERHPLKRCPFCNGVAIRASYKSHGMDNPAYTIECEKCEAQTGEYNHYTEAKKAWNKRIEKLEKVHE